MKAEHQQGQKIMKPILALVLLSYSCHVKQSEKRNLESDLFFNEKYGYHIRLERVNDSLQNLYFFYSMKDSVFTDLIFLKNNRCQSYFEFYRNNKAMSDFFNINDSSRKVVDSTDNNSFLVGGLLFTKCEDNYYKMKNVWDKFLYMPPINQDHYYYSIAEKAIGRKIKLFSNPDSVSSYKELLIGKELTMPLTISTNQYYYNQNDIFYLIGFGAIKDNSSSDFKKSDDDFSKKFFVREIDVYNFFHKSR
jgi:hypothetical protein